MLPPLKTRNHLRIFGEDAKERKKKIAVIKVSGALNNVYGMPHLPIDWTALIQYIVQVIEILWDFADSILCINYALLRFVIREIFHSLQRDRENTVKIRVIIAGAPTSQLDIWSRNERSNVYQFRFAL